MAAIVARRALGAGVVALSAIALLSRSENVVSRALQEVLFEMDAVTGHKVLSPMGQSDFLGVGSAILGLMIAAGGGIGGGGMLVPIYVLVLGFKPKYAIPLSNMTVLGGGFTNVFMNAKKRHPLADRSLVDWDLLILMQPLTLAGALVGGFVNKLAPELLITVLLVILLAVTSDKTVRKGLKLYAKETAAFERAAKRGDVELAELSKKQVLEEAASEGASLLGDDTGEEGGGASESRPARLSVEEQAELAAILAEERLAFPGWKAGVLIGMFVLTVAINLAKGGGAFPSPLGITCGSYGYWVATLVMFASLCAVAQYVRVYLIERTSTKLRLGYAFVEGDFLWDAHTTLKYPGICFFAGMCAGLFGIGGGIVNGPLMLEIGVLPGVAGATTAVMILLTAAVAGTTFLTFGLVQMDYAKYLFVVGLLATAVGQIGMTRLIKQTGRNSYIAFSIGAVVSLSTLLMGLHGLLSLAYPAEGHAGDGQNHGICASGD